MIQGAAVVKSNSSKKEEEKNTDQRAKYNGKSRKGKERKRDVKKRTGSEIQQSLERHGCGNTPAGIEDLHRRMEDGGADHKNMIVHP